ncbi:CAP Gly-rich domain-containing protein [Lipomyces arxii]|uniref:CAP Gly-rich domain-containing protein n=1 Tax=Lipomyces arxii TaxID=56418 RepID=UPI0034CDBB2D
MDVSVIVTSANTTSERRISYDWSISHFKTRLEQITGIPSSAQKLQLYVSEAEDPVIIVAPAGYSDNDANVGMFADRIVPYARLHVEDTRPPHVWENYTDVSEVDKFELSLEEYEKRTDTVLAWKKRNNLGRFGMSAERAKESKTVDSTGIQAGQRCLVSEPFERRGLVKFVGKVRDLPGNDLLWVGVEFDEPVGKNDGSIKGNRYFQSKPNHGSFLKADKVQVGDFPAIDEFLSEDEEL